MLWGSWALSAVPSQIQKSYSKCQFPQSQPRHLKEKKNLVNLSPTPASQPSFMCPMGIQELATTSITLQGPTVFKPTRQRGRALPVGEIEAAADKPCGYLCSER